MGCGSSKVFVVNEIIPGQNSEAMRMFRLLELSDDDIGKLYLAFKKFDVVNNDVIEINEFLPRLGLEKNRMTREVFADIDQNHDGRVNFKEFVLSVWKYVVRGKQDLAGFAFDMFDSDNSGYLTEDEVIRMVAELYGTKNLDQGVRKMINKMDKDRNHKISKKEFTVAVKSFPQILHPAFEIQTKMRLKICGESFWDHKQKTAARVLQNPDVKDILASTGKDKNKEVAAMHLPVHDHTDMESGARRKSKQQNGTDSATNKRSGPMDRHENTNFHHQPTDKYAETEHENREQSYEDQKGENSNKPQKRKSTKRESRGK